MNKLIQLNLLLILLFSFLTFSGQENGLLWRISGKGITKPSYLYGTIHIQDKRVFDFSDSVMTCISTADAFASELLISDLKSPDLLKAMIAKEGEQLDQILTKTEYEKTNKKFTSVVGMDLSVFNQMKPIAVFITMTQSLLAKDMTKTIDEYLSQQAETKGKKLLAVEKIETQVKVFDSFGKEELLASIDDWDESEEALEKMVVAYAKEDLSTLNDLTLEANSEVYKEFEKKLFGDRNITMTESISKIVQNQSTFIAIGAGHLPGKAGVLQRLRNKGYKIEVIKSPKTKSSTISSNGLVKGATYRVQFPKEPTLETQYVDSEIGELKLDIFTLQNPEPKNGIYFYMFGNCVYPEEYKEIEFSSKELKEMYDNSIEESFKAMGIKIDKQANIMFKGNPARKAKGTLQGLDLEMMCVYKKGVLYYTQTAVTKSEKINTDRKSFVNSLILK